MKRSLGKASQLQSKKSCLSTDGGETASASTTKMKAYKKNLKFSRKWKDKWEWIEYDTQEDGMYCSICKKLGKPPVSARGAWVTKQVRNWVNATELLRQRGSSDWHRASLQAQAMSISLAGSSRGDVVERLATTSEKERKKNREIVKMLLRSLYFLVKNHIPHTTMFKGVVQLQIIDNGLEQLKMHKEVCPSNASYLSTASTADFLQSISNHLEKQMLSRLQKSKFSLLWQMKAQTFQLRQNCLRSMAGM